MTWIEVCSEWWLLALLLACFAGMLAGCLLAHAFDYVKLWRSRRAHRKIAAEIQKWADRVDADEGAARVLSDAALGALLKRNVRIIIRALEA